MMKPRAKSDPVAQPSSAYQVFLGAKRVHKRHCYDLEHGDMVLSTIKAITKRVIAKHGYRFMVKRRKEPFTRAMLLKMLSKTLPAGTRLGPVTVSGKSKAYQSWRCLNAAAPQAGFRKDEMACKTKAQGMTPIQLTRSSLCFLIQGKYVRDPSDAEVRAMRSGCAVILEPRPSKADQGGFHWCDKPIFYPWSADDPICAASELVAQELMDPLHGDDRATKPLFSDSNGAPFSRSQVEAGIKAMTQLAVPASDVKNLLVYSIG